MLLQAASISNVVGKRDSVASVKCSTISWSLFPFRSNRATWPLSWRNLPLMVSPLTRFSDWVTLADYLRVHVAFSRVERSKIVRK